MENRRLLISYAHPDDESFGQGALISRYVDQGVAVYLICATNGDSGTVAPEMLDGYKSIAERRLAELDCAAEKLGLKQVFKLGYKDSGMMHTPSNDDPDCLWQAPREDVARRVVEVIRQVRPQVVITFNKYGGYGHPDHIAIQRATTDAFTRAGDPGYATGDLAPYAPQKLYYSAISTASMKLYLTVLRLRGHDPRRLGKNSDIDLQAVLDHVEPIHARIDIRAYHDAWDEANACHESQLGGGPRLPKVVGRFFQRRQGFTRVYPPPPANRVDEDDLFAGVGLEEAVQPVAQEGRSSGA